MADLGRMAAFSNAGQFGFPNNPETKYDPIGVPQRGAFETMNNPGPGSWRNMIRKGVANHWLASSADRAGAFGRTVQPGARTVGDGLARFMGSGEIPVRGVNAWAEGHNKRFMAEPGRVSVGLPQLPVMQERFGGLSRVGKVPVLSDRGMVGVGSAANGNVDRTSFAWRIDMSQYGETGISTSHEARMYSSAGLPWFIRSDPGGQNFTGGDPHAMGSVIYSVDTLNSALKNDPASKLFVSGCDILDRWKFAGIGRNTELLSRSANERIGSSTAFVRGSTKVINLWGMTPEPMIPGMNLWLVLVRTRRGMEEEQLVGASAGRSPSQLEDLISGEERLGRPTADLEATERDLVDNYYYRFVPYASNHSGPPPSHLWKTPEWIGGCVRVGTLTRAPVDGHDPHGVRADTCALVFPSVYDRTDSDEWERNKAKVGSIEMAVAID